MRLVDAEARPLLNLVAGKHEPSGGSFLACTRTRSPGHQLTLVVAMRAPA